MKKLLLSIFVMTALLFFAAPVHAKELYKLGNYKITYYCPCKICSDDWGRKTSTGVYAKSRHTIAVDPDIIPYGTHVFIDGIEFVAEDCGGGVEGCHIDIFVDTHQETLDRGVKHKDVYRYLTKKERKTLNALK